MATGTEVLDVGRRDHVVLFYRDEQELTERVSGIFSPPSTTAAWRSWSPRQITPVLRQYLANAGVDVAAACARGTYLAACAHQLDALTEVCHAHTQVTGTPPDAD